MGEIGLPSAKRKSRKCCWLEAAWWLGATALLLLLLEVFASGVMVPRLVSFEVERTPYS